jgi:hypothetical protein
LFIAALSRGFSEMQSGDGSRLSATLGRANSGWIVAACRRRYVPGYESSLNAINGLLDGIFLSQA